jgi:hypothetical protein
MPEKRPPTGKAARILQRRQPANPEELAAANRTIDAWQAQVWALPLADRQAALLTLLEVLDG